MANRRSKAEEKTFVVDSNVAIFIVVKKVVNDNHVNRVNY